MSEQRVLVQEEVSGTVHSLKIWIPVLVGRDSRACRIVCKGARVSRQHCELYAELDGRLRVKDLSAQGTFLNDGRVKGEAHCQRGDTIRLADGTKLKHVGLIDPARPRRDGEGRFTVPCQLTDRFLLLQPVGRGAAGIVYEAYDEREKARCALKLLVTGGPASAELIQRFKREAILQASLAEYPGIVTVREYDTVQESGEIFFTMDYVPGTTLRHRLKEHPPLKEGLKILSRVARAVSYAHKRGIIHRDLKPGNVMISEKGLVRLTDFGIAKVMEEGEGLTTTGVMLGTPNFMAPEQIDDSKRVTTAADVFSLGAILYIVLTYRMPFHGDTVADVLTKVQDGDLMPPREIVEDLDPELEDLCLRSLASDPQDRPASAHAFAQEIEAWLKGRDPPEKVSLQLPS